MTEIAQNAGKVAQEILARNFSVLAPASLEADGAQAVADCLPANFDIYESLLLGTASHAKRYYDWNVGFLVPHLDTNIIADVVGVHKAALLKSEGVAWGLGEAGSEDERIVTFLFEVCEACADYDAWWCAAEALEKLGVVHDATDLKKRTLRGEEWESLDACFEGFNDRAAVIGVLRQARADNTESEIIPRARRLLSTTEDRKILQNAVWLLERLRVDDDETISSLLELYERAEDISDSLRPRIVEALGEIATPDVRHLLEAAISEAKYYRTRAYAAHGLGRIGDSRSLQQLRRCLASEKDDRVVGYISAAIYAIEDETRRALRQRSRSARWPENGMIADQSNRWYANPEIYDRFAEAEDPLNISLDYAADLVPRDAKSVADLGSGTGRLAFRLAEVRPDIEVIHAVELSSEMVSFLDRKLTLRTGLKERILPKEASIDQMPLSDCHLDAAISAWAFPSSMWDPLACLREMEEIRRVLKPDGKLITLGWDESFRDELSELWYRFVPEPDFRRESIEEWRNRRRSRIQTTRNCHLTFVKRNIEVPLLFPNAADASFVLGHLFGYSAGEWVARQQRCEFSIKVGITIDSREGVENAIAQMREALSQ